MEVLNISKILSRIPNGSIYRTKLWCFYILPFYLLHICPHHTIVIKGEVWWVFPTQLLGKHTLLTNLIQMRRFKCRAGETWAVVFFSTGKIVNYFGTDWSQSAIELDYWLNGKCNEKALIWKESYEKAISITLESLNWDTSTPHQTHSTGSDTLTFSLFLYFLSSFFSLLMTVSANRDEHSCLFAFFPWNPLQLHSLKRHAFVTVNWLPLLMKYNFVFFNSIIDMLVQIITVLTAQLCWNHLTDTEWRNSLQCQHRTDYYRCF